MQMGHDYEVCEECNDVVEPDYLCPDCCRCHDCCIGCTDWKAGQDFVKGTESQEAFLARLTREGMR